MYSLLKAFKTGIMDGYEAPFDLSIGMTYQHQWRQYAWDNGCNFGQFLGKSFKLFTLFRQ